MQFIGLILNATSCAEYDKKSLFPKEGNMKPSHDSFMNIAKTIRAIT